MGRKRSRQERVQDLYEIEDSVAEEETQQGRKYDRVDNFQYELPEDFEDEEIDEDTAFTAEDELAFANIFAKRGNAEAEEDAEEDVDPAELTRDDFSEDDSEADRVYGKPSQQGRLQSGSDRDVSDVDDIFAGISEAEESDEESESDATPRQDSGDIAQAVREIVGPTKQRRTRKAQEVLDEAAPESEYNLSLGDGELTLADLINSIQPKSGKKTKAQKELAKLAEAPEAVPAPLPRPIKERKQRQAGYDLTKKDVKKWQPIVSANREAPTLVFNTAKNDVPRKSSTAALAENLKPHTGMEAEVAALLTAAGIRTEKGLEDAEEALALKNLSAEEMELRRNELAKMRSLMFRHEEKARRLAKIKSKDYHRRLNKAARRKAEKAGLLEDKDFIRLEAEKAEFERAKERLTLKHKNTSQWARRALKRGTVLHDDGTKEAIAEQLRFGEELRRRMDRMDPVAGSDTEASDASGSSEEDFENDAEGEGPSKARHRAKAKAKAAAESILEDDDIEGASKGLFSLPFMKRAQEKRKTAARDEALKALAELEGVPLEVEEQAPSGRRNFGLQGGIQANNAAPDFEVDYISGSDVEEDAEAKLARLRTAAENERRLSQTAANVSENPTANASSERKKPRQRASKSSSLKPKPTVKVIGQDFGSGKNSSSELPVVHNEAEEVMEREVAGSAVQSTLQRVAEQQGSLQTRAELLSRAEDAVSKPRKPSSRKKSKKVSVAFGGSESLPVAVEDEQSIEAEAGTQEIEQEAEDMLPRAQERAVAIAQPAVIDMSEPEGRQGNELGMTQQELIARAFAGDNVAAEFEGSKEAEIQAELPKVDAPSLMPGWGTWASQQREPGWMIEARSKAQREKEAARAARKDAKLKGVILSERFDKKSAKYNLPTLPFPFTSKEAYEGAMRHPLGADFNTEASHRAITKPAVIKYAGTVIEPIKFSQAVAEGQREMRKISQYSRQPVNRISGGMVQPVKNRSKAKAS